MIHRRVDGCDINRRNRRTRKGIITVVVLGPLSSVGGDERIRYAFGLILNLFAPGSNTCVKLNLNQLITNRWIAHVNTQE